MRQFVSYYYQGGLLLALQSVSYRLFGRDLITPPLVPLYRQYVAARGGVVTYCGVKFDASDDRVDDLLGQFLTSYELSESVLVDRHLPADRDVLEIGAGIGFLSCYTNARLNEGAEHVVVEANPKLLDLIEETKRRNGCGFEVIHAAYTPKTDDVEFNVHEEFLSSGVTERAGGRYRERVTVEGVDLATLQEQFDLEGFVLLLDVEGVEHDLLREEADRLTEQCALLFVEFHEIGGDVDKTVDRLREAGFVAVDRHDDVRVFENASLRATNRPGAEPDE